MAGRADDSKRGGKADESSPEIKTLKEIGLSLLTASSRGSKAQLSKATAKAAARAMETITDAAAQQPDAQSQRAYKAWSGSCAELLSLFGLALRQSSRSLCPDSPREEVAMHAQLREGLFSDLMLLSAAARSLGNIALLSRLGCALLRTGTLQCYAAVLSDAALQLQPAARAACADLPDWPNMRAMEEMLKAVLGRSGMAGGGLASPRGRAAAVSSALRLVGEVVRLLELLGACSSGQFEPAGSVSGVVLRHLSRALGQGLEARANEKGSAKSDTGARDNVAGCGEHRELLRASIAASSSGHVYDLYQQATGVLLLVAAAAHNSGTHQRTHEAASQLATQLVAGVCRLEQGMESVTRSARTDYGSAVAALVQLCADLDGGTTYGMAPGLWPRLGGDGVGGAEAEGALLTKLRLCLTLEAWGEGPTRYKGLLPAAQDGDEQATLLADTVGMLYRLWSDTDNFRVPVQGSRAFVMSPAEAKRMAQRFLDYVASNRFSFTWAKLPPCSLAAMLQLCIRLARCLLARGRLAWASGGCSPSGAPAAGAAEKAGAAAGAGAGTIAGGEAATEEDAAAGAGGSGFAVSGRHGALSEAGAGAGADLLPKAHRVLDRLLFQAAMVTTRAVLQPQCGRPAHGRAGARRLARLKGWWEVVVEAVRQGVVGINMVEVAEDSRLQEAVAEEVESALPRQPTADVVAALEAGLLPCCAQLLRHSGLGGGGAGGSFSGGDGEPATAPPSSGRSGSSSSTRPPPPTDAGLSQRLVRMEGFLDHSSRFSSLLSSFQSCSWSQLLAFGRREEVHELTSALAWRLGWQVGQLRGAMEEQGSKVTGRPAHAAPGSGTACHAEEAGDVLLFAADRLDNMLWLRGRGAGGGHEGDTARHAAALKTGPTKAGPSEGGTAQVGTSEAGTSGVGIDAKSEGSCSNGEGEPASVGEGHTSTCSAQQHHEPETSASPGFGAGSSGGDARSDGGGACGALDGAGRAASVEAAGSSSAVDYGCGAGELWAEVSELLPAAARGVLACAELLWVTAVGEGAGGASGGEERGGGEDGDGARGDGSGEDAAVAAAMKQIGEQLAPATWQCCMSVLACASLLLLAHVGAEAAGTGGEASPWHGVLLREVHLAELLGAEVRLWGLVEPWEGWEARCTQARAMHAQLMELAAVAFPAELRAVVQDEGAAAGEAAAGEAAAGEAAAGEAAAGSGWTAAADSSPACPGPWCRVTLRAVRDALGSGAGGAELHVVGRVAGGWEPAAEELRALLEQGAGRLAAALWGRKERRLVDSKERWG